MKREISLVCAFLTALTMLQPAVCAAEETTTRTYRNFKYEERGDHIILTSYTHASNKEVIVPSTILGLPVTEAAEGLFPSSCRYAFHVIWADTIPVIPSHAFSEYVRTVVIPDTVTEIGDDIFGNNSEVDIFYKGTAEQWDAIKVGKGNSALMDCNIHCEWGAGETPFSFDFSEDTWSFTNASVEKYMFSKEAGERYFADLTDRNRQYLQGHLEAISSARGFPGICGGMAVSSYLYACGMLDPSDIYPGAKTLREIPLCDEVREALNLYLDLSSLGLGAVIAGIGDEYDENYMEYLSWNIQDYLGDGFMPGVVMLPLYSLGGIHAVVAYGTESGEWVIDGVTYHDRILIYDNNAPDPETDANLYVADDGTFYDPFYSEEGAIQVFGLLSRPDIYPFMIGQRTVYEPTYELGDLDQDGAANAADASDILTISTEQGTGRSVDMTIGELYAADVDGDGSVNAVDASIILTYSTAQAVSDHTLDIKDFT